MAALTKRQKEVLGELRAGRKLTYHGYYGSPPAATWDDESWTPGQQNHIVVVRALRKKDLVNLVENERNFHVYAVELTDLGKTIDIGGKQE